MGPFFITSELRKGLKVAIRQRDQNSAMNLKKQNPQGDLTQPVPFVQQMSELRAVWLPRIHRNVIKLCRIHRRKLSCEADKFPSKALKG